MSKGKRTPRAPKGFRPLRDTPKRAEENIAERLKQAKAALAKLDARVLVHSYSDGTVDGELSVQVPRGVSEEQLYRQILDAFGQNPGHIGPGYWISVGQRYSIKEGDAVYRRNRGMNELATYYASMARRAIIPATFGIARHHMTPGAHATYHRKAANVFVRIHWNPERKKPKR